jgi:predicted DNA-binding transcriptional regulator AlpA
MSSAARAPDNSDVLLIDVKGLATLLAVSPRMVWKLRDAGGLPQPVRLGSSRCVRWIRSDIAQWIAEGCPSCRPPATGPRSRVAR